MFMINIITKNIMSRNNLHDTEKDSSSHVVDIERFIEKYLNISDIDTSLSEEERYVQLKKKFGKLCEIEQRLDKKREEIIYAMDDCYEHRYP